jgi:hypothetical protein
MKKKYPIALNIWMWSSVFWRKAYVQLARQQGLSEKSIKKLEDDVIRKAIEKGNPESDNFTDLVYSKQDAISYDA